MKASRRRFFGLAAVAPVAVQAKVPMVEMVAADIAPVQAAPVVTSWYSGYTISPEIPFSFDLMYSDIPERIRDLSGKIDADLRKELIGH